MSPAKNKEMVTDVLAREGCHFFYFLQGESPHRLEAKQRGGGQGSLEHMQGIIKRIWAVQERKKLYAQERECKRCYLGRIWAVQERKKLYAQKRENKTGYTRRNWAIKTKEIIYAHNNAVTKGATQKIYYIFVFKG